MKKSYEPKKPKKPANKISWTSINTLPHLCRKTRVAPPSMVYRSTCAHVYINTRLATITNQKYLIWQFELVVHCTIHPIFPCQELWNVFLHTNYTIHGMGTTHLYILHNVLVELRPDRVEEILPVLGFVSVINGMLNSMHVSSMVAVEREPYL